MKKLIITTIAALMVASCGKVHDEYYERVESTPPGTEEPDPGPDPGPDPNPSPGDPDSYWYKAADSATMELLNRYWPPLLSRIAPASDDVSRWAFTETNDVTGLSNTNYWPQAHAMDAIIDAYNRTPSGGEFADMKELWLSIYDRWFQGVPRMQWMSNENWGGSQWTSRYPHVGTGNAGGWRNEYIDDMEWMVLTHIRMYESLRYDDPTLAAKYLEMAKEIYDEFIWEWAWDYDAGGLYWKRDTSGTNTKNACSNGPGMVIAAKLAYYSSGNEREEYLAQAEKIYDWMMGHLWNDNGAISDAWTGTSKSGGATTYNQGTFIGGCHWLYKLTGDEKYLQSAITVTNYTINSMQDTGEGGVRILQSNEGSEEGGNNAVFRAIFLRYFVPLINEPVIDEIAPGTCRTWYQNLENWANYVWRDGLGIDKGDGTPTNPGNMLFGSTWARHTTITSRVHLGNQVSGAVLIESMNIVEPVE